MSKDTTAKRTLGPRETRIKGATLRAFRRKEGLSQSALAAKATDVLRDRFPDDPDVGVSESLIALIETERRQTSRRNAEAIATALDLDDPLALVEFMGQIRPDAAA